MPCNACKMQFNLFKRKRSCISCHYFYCLNCLGKRRKNLCICNRCEIIIHSNKNDLMLLKTKDLIFFLQSRKINIAGIVEKEELCNLIISHINSTTFGECSSSAPPDFDNYSHNFDQIKQTCQNFFTSFTEKIASDLQKTTCFNQASHLQKESNNINNNVTTQSSKLNVQSTFNCENPGTSGISRTEMEHLIHRNVPNCSHFINSNQNDCECCSDEELAEISEKCQSILNSDLKDLVVNAKKAKLESSSSDSSFEDVANKQTGDHDDDWQIVENEKSESFSDTLKLQNNIITNSPKLNVSTINCARRKSDSSLLNLTKSNLIDSFHSSTHKNDLSSIRISCKKCGKSRSKIKNELLKLNAQLKSSNRSESEISAKIKEFIQYLDTKLDSNDSTEAPSDHIMGSSSLPNPETSEYNNNTTAESAINENGNDDKPTCSLSTTKRFMTLNDIHSSEDLDLLSVKQLKELLALNRVDFKGCCEKKELKERVQRLWESYTNSPSSDKLSSTDLCKICMDAPIECVFLECGHTATCTSCGKVLSECPICRSYIVRVVRIFKS